MLAARYDRTGPARDVIRVEDVERPEPGPGEVLIRLRVSGVNPTDWKSRSGLAGRPLEFRFQVPNQDGAGVIDSVGEGVDPRRVGERVWVFFAAWRRQWGTAAQWTVVPAQQAVSLPDDTSEDVGATLGIPALTAHRCLFADGPIMGRTVLVAGGAGAVGHAAIQLARWGGATVVATVSSDEKAGLARKAGAHAVVNYREEDAAESVRRAAPDGADRIVEVGLAPNLELDLDVSAPNAVISTYGAEGGAEPTIPLHRLIRPNLSLRFVLVYTMPAAAIRQAVSDVTNALHAGAITTLPLHCFPLDRVADAHDAVESGAVGKVLVDIP